MLIMPLICLAICLVLPSGSVVSEPLKSGCNHPVDACPFNEQQCIATLSANKQAVGATGGDFSHCIFASTVVIQVGKIGCAPKDFAQNASLIDMGLPLWI